jgi:hypothetical protein
MKKKPETYQDVEFLWLAKPLQMGGNYQPFKA